MPQNLSSHNCMVKANSTLRTAIALTGALLITACQSDLDPDYRHNILQSEKDLIESISRTGPAGRYVIDQTGTNLEVVDRYTISLTESIPYAMTSESQSTMIGTGSVVQFCGSGGEFRGIQIVTNSPYSCRRGEGLVFGVTRHGWVHLYGDGEIAGNKVSIAKP